MRFLACAKPESDESAATVFCNRRIVVRYGSIEMMTLFQQYSTVLLFYSTGVDFRIDIASLCRFFQWEQYISLNFL
jgi:hypothetical protein